MDNENVKKAILLLADEVDLLRAYAQANGEGRARLIGRLRTTWKRQAENGVSFEKLIARLMEITDNGKY